MYATQASVVIVKPAGTRSGPRIRVISETFAPFPPRSSRMSRPPSSNAYTHLVSVAVVMLRMTPDGEGARVRDIRQFRPARDLLPAALAHGLGGRPTAAWRAPRP